MADKREDELALGEKINVFMNKYRKAILIGFIGIVIALSSLIVTTIVRDRMQSSALTRLDALMQTYNDVLTFMRSDTITVMELATNAELFDLLDELTDFGNRNSGFAAGRAFTMKAEIYWEMGNWEEAETAWLQAARSTSRSYLAPISFFNAGVAAEELGKFDTAIAHYSSALTYGDQFPGAARAQFSIGRLEESRNNRDAALAAYRNLVNTWPEDPVWPDLAQSRIIVLTE